MDAVAGSLDIDDNGMVHHAIDHGGGDHRIAQIFPKGFKIDVGGQDGGLLAIAALDDFEEKRGVAAGFLLQAVKADFVNEQQLGSDIGL
jgi:hypothetical protein